MITHTFHLFAYGTLMCQEIMARVCGQNVEGVAATLTDYARRAVRNETYPALIPEAGARVDGIFYPDIEERAWHRLDAFEGSMYRRETVTVLRSGHEPVIAETYVIHPAYAGMVEPRAWDYQVFLQAGKEAFLSRYAGFARLG